PASPPRRDGAGDARPGNRTNRPAKSTPPITNIANNRFIDVSLQIAEIEEPPLPQRIRSQIRSSVFMPISNSTFGVTVARRKFEKGIKELCRFEPRPMSVRLLLDSTQSTGRPAGED